MDVYILNQSFEEIGVIDVFQSLIWTTRYYECGDFELYAAADPQILPLLSIGNYVTREDDENIMIIENIEIKTDIQNGNYVVVTGRCLKSLLDRRVIYPQQILTGDFERAVFRLVDNICGAFADEARYFPNFATGEYTGNHQPTINAQVTGEELYSYLVELFKQYGYGWKITRNGRYLIFDLFKGVERQEVEFSPEFDNLINSDYIISSSGYKNAAYIAGEGEGTARITEFVGNTSGFARREIYVDANDVSTNDGEITNEEYRELLKQRGYENLAEMPITQDFTGSTIADIYEYKKDYDIGDIVTVTNEYGISAETRIVEIIESWSSDKGYTIIPTYEKWETNAVG